MMMVVDAANIKKDFAVICDELEELGTEIGVAIRCQREKFSKRCIDCKRYHTETKSKKRICEEIML